MKQCLKYIVPLLLAIVIIYIYERLKDIYNFNNNNTNNIIATDYLVYVILLIVCFFVQREVAGVIAIVIIVIFLAKLIKQQRPIPFIIHQTWMTKELPTKMKECVEKLKKENPEFEHRLYDDEECRVFIKDNFDSDVLSAYDSLIPGAYKADLFRYCVLYIDGGIYMDIKFKCKNNFKLKKLMDKEHFVLDSYTLDTSLKGIENIEKSNYYNKSWQDGKIGIYNAFICVKPKNRIIKKCIHKVVENVKNKYYGYSSLYPTGPGMMSQIVSIDEYRKIDLFNSTDGKNIVHKKYGEILMHYPEFRKEQKLYSKKKYYSDYWLERNIYI